VRTWARALALLAVAALPGLAGAGAAEAQNIRVLGGDVVLDPPTAVDFLAGYSVSGTLRARVNARKNDAWRLELRAATADMGGAGKPVSDVLWRPEASSTWVPLSLGWVPVTEGVGNGFVTIHFRVRLEWATDLPGSYAAPLELGITPL
jgi:hypothetical protein